MTRQEIIAYSAGASVAAIVVLSTVYFNPPAPGPQDQQRIFKAAEEIIKDTSPAAVADKANVQVIKVKPSTSLERSSW